MPQEKRRFVLVSGYYGFGNLGDEAILEELTNELKKLISPSKIIVLSNDPESTQRTFGVQSLSRWKPLNLLSSLPQTLLFISGGGGLFQDVTGLKSTIYYGCQILLARILGSRVLVYAQGVGPLHNPLAKSLTRLSLSAATETTVRDSDSFALLSHWHIKPALTADPVWCLEPSPIPDHATQQIASLKDDAGLLVGLSLRKAGNFTQAHLSQLVASLDQALPADAQLLLLPLQDNQDLEPLGQAMNKWKELGRKAEILNTKGIERPSQWISILSQLDMLIGMRLHALIMSLRSGVPVVGIAYDPKVAHVLKQFGQPILNLTKENEAQGISEAWLPIVKGAVANRQELSSSASLHAEAAKKLACQNFEVLARILEHAK